AGAYNTCALLGDRTVRCWGQNSYGEVGNGSVSNFSTPVVVAGVTNPRALAVGGYHTCALRPDTSVGCWGENDFGELGNGATVSSPAAVQVYGTGLTWTSTDTSVATVDANGTA